MSVTETSEDRHIEVKVEVPSDLSWEEIVEIEDEMSEAVGDILKDHGLSRNTHKRIVDSDYS